jgi:hypothetical protein
MKHPHALMPPFDIRQKLEEYRGELVTQLKNRDPALPPHTHLWWSPSPKDPPSVRTPRPPLYFEPSLTMPRSSRRKDNVIGEQHLGRRRFIPLHHCSPRSATFHRPCYNRRSGLNPGLPIRLDGSIPQIGR